MEKKYFRLTSGLLPRLFLLLLLAAGLAACSKEDKPVGPDSDELATVKLSLADVEMRAGDLYSGEDLIKTIRICVFREGTGGLLVVDKQKLYKSGETDFNNPFEITAHAGPRHVYVIANEPAILTEQLDRLLFKYELDALQMPVVAVSAVQPFMMTGKTATPVTLNPNHTVSTTISLVRAVAKITLDIKQTTPVGDVVKIVGASILRNAQNSRLVEGSTSKPTAFWNWTSNYNLSLTNNGGAQDLIPNTTPLYVYENIGSVSDTTGRATQLVIEAIYNGVKTRYYGYVNDATTATDHHYAIHRNHHYKLSGTITKMGEFSALLLNTEVLPWTVENLNYDFLVPHFVMVNPQTVLTQDNYVTQANPLSFQVKIKGTNGSQWQATLDNGLEFGIIGTTTGAADGETTYTVQVKPLKAPGNSERRANLYFTVNGKKVVLKLDSGEQLSYIKVVQGAS